MSQQKSQKASGSQTQNTPEESKDLQQKQEQTAQGQLPLEQPPLNPASPKTLEEEKALADAAEENVRKQEQDRIAKAQETEESRLEAEAQEARRNAPKLDIAAGLPVAGTAPDRPVAQAKAQKRSLTKGESLDKHKYAQSVDPESIKHISGNVDSDYKLPDYEENLVHVELEQRVFSQLTGEKQSTPYIQKFWPQEYADAVERNGFKGYTVTVKHRPAVLDEIEKAKAARRK